MWDSEKYLYIITINFQKWSKLNLATRQKLLSLWCSLVCQLHQQKLRFRPKRPALSMRKHVGTYLSGGASVCRFIIRKWAGVELCGHMRQGKKSQHDMQAQRAFPPNPTGRRVAVCVCRTEIFSFWSSDWHSIPSAEAQLLRAAARPPVAQPDRMHTEWISSEGWRLN